MKLEILAGLALLAAPAPAPTEAPSREGALAGLAKVEGEFAALAAEKDWVHAFQTFFAYDGVLFVPQPALAREELKKLPPEAANQDVAWFATWTDIARSADLGFNLGPYTWTKPGPE